MGFTKQITNKQGREADPRKHYHVQGFTCDCRHCGEEFSQYYAKHVYCSDVCMWDRKGIHHEERTCSDCGVTEEATLHGSGYVCRICKMLRLNPTRTDVKRRTPSPVGKS